MKQPVIDRALAQRVLEVVDAGLVKGLGEPTPGKMCVEAAVNYAMGAPHGDQPACVANSLRRLKIRLNDARWSSDKARTAGLRRLAIAQLGSAGALDETEFKRRVATLAIQKSVPEALRAAAAGVLKGSHKEQFLKMADLCEREPTKQHAREAKAAAAAAYAATVGLPGGIVYGVAATVAGVAAYAVTAADAAYAATAADATWALAAAIAAYAAAYVVVVAADGAAISVDGAHDKSLASFAEAVVQILIDMKAPGCEWLDLIEPVTPSFARPST